MHQKNTRRIRG